MPHDRAIVCLLKVATKAVAPYVLLYYQISDAISLLMRLKFSVTRFISSALASATNLDVLLLFEDAKPGRSCLSG